MTAKHSCQTVRLAARQTRVLSHAAGTEVRCVSGQVWITFHGDPTDYVLRPGQSMVLALPTALVMSSARGAELCLVPERQEAPARRGWLARLAGWLDPRWSGRAADALQGRVGGAGV